MKTKMTRKECHELMDSAFADFFEKNVGEAEQERMFALAQFEKKVLDDFCQAMANSIDKEMMEDQE